MKNILFFYALLIMFAISVRSEIDPVLPTGMAPQSDALFAPPGFEITSHIFGNNHSQAYWANDLQMWQRTQYEPMFNSQIGIKRGGDLKNGRGISYFLEFTTGPEYYGQFFKREEARIGLGAKFDIN